jgi:hypothetical protein
MVRSSVMRNLNRVMIGTAAGLVMIGCGGAQERAEWEDSRVVYTCPTHENIDETVAAQLAERDLVGVTEALADIDDQRCWRSALRVASHAPGGDSFRVASCRASGSREAKAGPSTRS